MEQTDQELNNFLKLNFYYKNKYNKNIKNYDIIITIPKGRKYFVWLKNDKYYFFEHDTFNNKIKKGFNIKGKKEKLFGDENSTLLFGTLFKYSNSLFFNIENLFYFNNKYVYKKTYIKKLLLIKKILKVINRNDVCFGLPIIERNKEKILNEIENIPYEIYCLQHKYLEKNNNSIYNEKIKKKNESLTFMVKANVKADSYLLYYKKNNKNIYYDTALINTINLSIYMNKLFRNIEENDNIDLIEESDDEDYFEDINIKKDIKNDLEINMKCYYSDKFNAWIPINISKSEVCKLNDINKIMKL